MYFVEFNEVELGSAVVQSMQNARSSDCSRELGIATIVALISLLLFAYVGWPVYCYRQCHANTYTCIVERHSEPETVVLANGENVTQGYTIYYTARTVDRHPELHVRLTYDPHFDKPNTTRACNVHRNALVFGCGYCMSES